MSAIFPSCQPSLKQWMNGRTSRWHVSFDRTSPPALSDSSLHVVVWDILSPALDVAHHLSCRVVESRCRSHLPLGTSYSFRLSAKVKVLDEIRLTCCDKIR